ncbi:MAG TPA: YggT family protein [Polyangiaceae bacterium]|jgi:uncharacterized protein YggT (Ycf19 family)
MATEVIREEHYERPHVRLVALLARLVDLAFGLLYTLLLIRLVLVFFAARPGAGFYQLIHNATEPFYRPFEGLFTTTTFNGWHLEWSLLVALVVYALVHGAIRGVMSLLVR